MKIGLDALSLRPGRIGGGETYIVSLVRHLAKLDRSNSYVIFTLPGVSSIFEVRQDNFAFYECPIPGSGGRQVARRFLYEQFWLPGEVRRQGIDVMLFLSNFAAVNCPCAFVVTIHDLACLFYARRFGNEYGRIRSWIIPRLIRRSAMRARKIAASSQYTRESLIREMGIPSDKIAVVYLGIEADYVRRAERTLPPEASDERIRPPYVLHLGTQNHHKNLVRLVEAFVRMKSATGLPHQLILAGMKGSASEALNHKLAELNSPDIIDVGRVSDENLHWLYRNAELFAFPTLYEGFGLPLLEVMSWGVPVVVSNAMPLPEVAGDAALYFDPLDVDSIAEVMAKALTDSDLRESLRTKGFQRVGPDGVFSWERTAREMLQLIESAAKVG